MSPRTRRLATDADVLTIGELPEPDPTLSRDATHSTYALAPEPQQQLNPPPGQGVEQTLGKPTETTPASEPTATTTSETT